MVGQTLRTGIHHIVGPIGVVAAAVSLGTGQDIRRTDFHQFRAFVADALAARREEFAFFNNRWVFGTDDNPNQHFRPVAASFSLNGSVVGMSVSVSSMSPLEFS